MRNATASIAAHQLDRTVSNSVIRRVVFCVLMGHLMIELELPFGFYRGGPVASRCKTVHRSFITGSMTMRMRTKIATFTLVALTFLASMSRSQESDEETIAAKALRMNTSLRATLETPVFNDLKDGLPHGMVNGKMFWYAEGDLVLDEDELLFYAKQRENQRITFALAHRPNWATSSWS